MPVVRIEQFDDARLAEYRNLSDKELLRSRNRFVVEGRLVVTRLVEASQGVASVLVNEASYRALAPALSALPDSIPVYVCDTDGFSAITGFNLHRGCLALAERPVEQYWGDVAQRANLLLVLEEVTDADNVGSAFRNAAAFGASVLLTDGCCDPLYRKAVRTSMGTVLHTPYARVHGWPAELSALKNEGFTVVALTPREHAVDLSTSVRQYPRIALVVGSEGPGLSDAVETMADLRVRIPTRTGVDSLNLATATGIALYLLANS